jgi:NAD(P)-dependent dehydrogenase (short-subunit alcohol dehydrogenase family)
MTAVAPNRWTADAIPDLSGLTAVVTGANSGIGYHTTLELARYGATVVMACRDLRKGEAALARMKQELGRPALALRRLDLADLATVRAFAVEIRTAHPRLEILVNNAGIMAVPRGVTPDGFELQLGVNHLGHFALTGLLFPCLTGAGRARVVTVASASHAVGRIDFDDLMSERRYGRWRAYAQSKLANLLFAFELQRRAEHLGVDLVSAASHPGYAATNLQHPWSQARPPGWLLRTAGDLAAQPAAAGALPSLYAATMPDVRGHDFIGPRWFGLRGSPTRARAAARAYDTGTAARLWDHSVALTGVDFARIG